MLLVPGTARADAGLQLLPLKYEEVLTNNRVKTGHIDVSNPSDTNATIQTSVRGFRQADLAGNLEFYTDDNLTAGIRPGLDQFELGSRESIRVTFTVNPTKLPQGGVYAAIFFRTVPPTPAANTSYIAEAANVGTLLMLKNGGDGVHVGQIKAFDLPFWQPGPGLKGRMQYHNANRDIGGVAFYPKLESRVLPWVKPAKLTGPFVMPGSTRQFEFVRGGSYIGLLPVTVTDIASGKHVTRWVLACTGNYQLLVVLLAILLAVWLLGWWRGWAVLARRPQTVSSRPMDGLSRRQE